MKIVDVCAFYTPMGGGVKTYVERKLAAALATGNEIVILAPGQDHGVQHYGPNARIVTLPAPRFPLDRRYRYFNDAAAIHAALDRERPDMVEASSPWRSASIVAEWKGSAPRALIMHADPLSAYAYRWFSAIASRETIDRRFDWFWKHLRRLSQGYDCFVSANASLTARLNAGGIANVVTNPMGVEPGQFSPMLRDEALRTEMLARCSLGPDATLLMGIGRHAPEKRWPMVIDAVIAAGSRHPVGLVLIGDGRDRARTVRAIGGNPHIHLLSPLTDRLQLARLLASADALIHGCEAETFCLVAAEARASGVPVIAPDQGGAADHCAPGARYRAGDAASAAAAISDSITALRGLRHAATAQAGAVRTMDQHFNDLFAYYSRLTGGLRHAA